MTQKNTIEKKLNIRIINIAMILLAVIISFVFNYAISDVLHGYQNMKETSEEIIDVERKSLQLKGVSSDQTEQARNFVMNYDMKYAQKYFEQYDSAENRINMIQSLYDAVGDFIAQSHLRMALTNAYKLDEHELYAFMLAFDAYDVSPSEYPKKLSDMHLDEKYAKLTKEEKLQAARDLLFSDEYQNHLASVNENIDVAISELCNIVESEAENDLSVMENAINRQRFTTVASLIMIVAAVAVIWYTLMRPLARNTEHIKNKEHLEPVGLSEMQMLASAYNDMYDNVVADRQKLSYEATHDELTGLYNRKAYDLFMKSNTEQICFMLVDIDDFKKINDNYGHDIGDKVLKRLANVLNHSFRNEDKAYRIGGDEMVVILKNLKAENKQIVIDKVNAMFEVLAKPEGDTPAISISVGVSFSDDKDSTGNLYKDSDLALYAAKNSGKSALVFYEKGMDNNG